MLTNISNISEYKDVKEFEAEHLNVIFDCLFGGIYWIGVEKIGGGFRNKTTQTMAERIVDNYDIDNDNILIINDISFHLYDYLTDCGFNPKHIYLAYGEFDTDGNSTNNPYAYNAVSQIAKYNFKEFSEGKINILTIKEAEEMAKTIKFNQVIVNPPYKIGNKVISSLVDNTDFDTMINLMPKSKYKGQKLYEHVESIETVDASEFEEDGASIGDCLTVAVLKKERTGKFDSYEELEATTYDERFKKFYEDNDKLEYTFKLGAYCSRPDKPIKDYNDKKDFFLYQRVSAHGIDMKGDTYNWNYQKGDITRLIRHYDDRGYMVYGQFISFNTEIEFINFRSFWYNKNLSHKLIKGMNKTGGTVTPAIPRVDWSHPWTDEEILKEYGYTDEEIKEILNDETH